MLVQLTFIDDVLGLWPSTNIARGYLEQNKDPKKAKEEDDALPLETQVKNARTVFHRSKDNKPCKSEEGIPSFMDYQLKGLFKAACAALARDPKSHSSKLKAFRKIITGNVFVFPRFLPMYNADGTPVKTSIVEIDKPTDPTPECSGGMTTCPRPLRAETPQGPRTSISDSETVPAGATLTCEIKCLGPFDKYVEEWLDYGQMAGLGAWRGAGKGRFTWKRLD